MKCRFSVFLLLCIVFSLGAEVVKEQEDHLVYRQPDGREILVKKNPKRVVVAYASLASVWDLAGGKAVGVSFANDDRAIPPAMKHLPRIGGSTVPNVERITMLSPDLVLLTAKLSRQRQIADLLNRTGIPAVCVQYVTYHDFADLLDFFCKINSTSINAVPRASQIVNEVSSLCRETKKLNQPRCAVLFAAGAGFFVESKLNTVGGMVSMLGAENIRRTDSPARIHFSYEQLLVDDPDVILITAMGTGLKERFEKEFMQRPEWKSLQAVKNNRVHFLPGDLFLYMPGPRYPEAFRYLAKLLYPEMAF